MSEPIQAPKFPDASPTRSMPSPAYWLAYPLFRLLLSATLRTLAPSWRVSGRENVPARGGVLFCPNHVSDCDPPVIFASMRRPLWFMAKRELFDIKVLGPLIQFAQAFPVERGGADRAALRRGEELLRNGQALVVFPEGRLAIDGVLQPLLPGATLLALRAEVPVVPVGIWGSNKIIPYGSVTPRPTCEPVRVHFGQALDFSNLKSLPSRAQREQSTQRVEEALRTAVEVAKST